MLSQPDWPDGPEKLTGVGPCQPVALEKPVELQMAERGTCKTQSGGESLHFSISNAQGIAFCLSQTVKDFQTEGKVELIKINS